MHYVIFSWLLSSDVVLINAGVMLSSAVLVSLCSSVLLCCSGHAFKIHSLCYLQLIVIFWWGVDGRRFHVILCSSVLLCWSGKAFRIYACCYLQLNVIFCCGVDTRRFNVILCFPCHPVFLYVSLWFWKAINAGSMLCFVFHVIFCSSVLLCCIGKAFKIQSLCYLQLNGVFQYCL